MSYEHKLRKVIKYFFILLAVLITLTVAVFFYALSEEVQTGEENRQDKQGELGRTAQNQIVLFYKKNGYYPKSLQDLPIYNDPDFAILLQKNHTFRYSTYGANEKSKYVFTWSGGAMNWTGYRCTNYKGKDSQEEHGVIRTYKMPGGTVCTVTDLH